MKFGFIAKHRSVWPVAWLFSTLAYRGLASMSCWKRGPCARRGEAGSGSAGGKGELSGRLLQHQRCASDLARRPGSRLFVRLAQEIERLMRAQALRARLRSAPAENDSEPFGLGNRAECAWIASSRRPSPTVWIADFTYAWTAEGWLYVAAVADLFAGAA